MNCKSPDLKESLAALIALNHELDDEPQLRNAIEESNSLFETLGAHFPSGEFSNLVSDAERTSEMLKKRGIEILPITCAQYPQRLRHIYQPPLALLHRGDAWEKLKGSPCIAVVGSRKADQFGCDTARGYAREIASRGGCVVSGLAYGLDAAAHRGALDSRMPASTVAILGNGLAGPLYPAAHTHLADEIVKAGGMLISQFAPDSKPYPSNFLNRNRVIAGLSNAVLIVQAAQRSGALSTARHAVEEGRDVLVVPGDIRDPLYMGSNELLKQGAHLIANFSDIAAQMPQLVKSAKVELSPSLSEAHHAILAALEPGPRSVDEAKPEGLDFPDFSSLVLELEAAGLVARIPGNQLMICRRA